MVSGRTPSYLIASAVSALCRACSQTELFRSKLPLRATCSGPARRDRPSHAAGFRTQPPPSPTPVINAGDALAFVPTGQSGSRLPTRPLRADWSSEGKPRRTVPWGGRHLLPARSGTVAESITAGRSSSVRSVSCRSRDGLGRLVRREWARMRGCRRLRVSANASLEALLLPEQGAAMYFASRACSERACFVLAVSRVDQQHGGRSWRGMSF